MWVSPNHPNPPRPQEAPQDSGRRLATFQRGRSGEELRVTFAEYEGHPFISLRVWAPGSDGQLWPVKGKGVSIRIREVAELAAVLTNVAEQLEAEENSPTQRFHREARSHPGHGTPSPASARPASSIPMPAPWEPTEDAFDEFEGTEG